MNKTRRNRQRRAVAKKRETDRLIESAQTEKLIHALFEAFAPVADGELKRYEKRAALVEETLLPKPRTL
jgi:hypothetical protein